MLEGGWARWLLNPTLNNVPRTKLTEPDRHENGLGDFRGIGKIQRRNDADAVAGNLMFNKMIFVETEELVTKPKKQIEAHEEVFTEDASDLRFRGLHLGQCH